MAESPSPGSAPAGPARRDLAGPGAEHGGQAQAQAGAEPAGGNPDRVLTIPNLLSMARLLGVPVLLVLVLGPHDDRVAFVLLMASGATDYLDGYLARRLRQVSRIGTLLDPLADRLYIFATVLALTIRGITPVWLIAILVARDAVLTGLLPVLRRHGLGPLPVSYLGKAATLNLLYAFPSLLLSSGHDGLATVARPLGWAFALWGTGLYVLSAGLYLRHAQLLVGRGLVSARAEAPSLSVTTREREDSR